MFFHWFQLWIRLPIIHIQRFFMIFLYRQRWFGILSQLFFCFIKREMIKLLLIWFRLQIILRQHLIWCRLIHWLRFHNQLMIWLQRLCLRSCWLQLRLSIKWVFIRQHLRCLCWRLRQFGLKLRLGWCFQFWLIQLRQLKKINNI